MQPGLHPITYLPTIPDSPELLRKSASNYIITARGKIITEIVDYGNCHANECIMFTVLTVMVAETLRESGLRAGFCKTADAARPNQTFEEGHTHVCILRGVTRATLIFLLDLLKLL